MRAAISLLMLLYSMCAVQTRPGQGTETVEVSTQPHISAEVKELRDMVVELRVTLRYTRDELKVLEADNVAVKERLAASETKVAILDRVLHDTKAEMKTEVDALKKENVAQEAELAVLKTRLAASEAEVIHVRKETAALSAEPRSVAQRLADIETSMEQLKKDTATQHTVLATLKAEVINLTKNCAATESDVRELKINSAAHDKELAALKISLAAMKLG
ncbi:uncharacterized protein LOC134440945 [Engraulis encrasicolus]|uniref:uncharacterized protein LOC134440945 n=1 Tax=Engraulis encrasicolus TaxID=184585 RepID=UPI002FD5E2CC